MAVSRKKKSPFLRNMLLLLIGFTLGMGVAATIAVYVNELHLPLITSPTRTLDPQRDERETVEFHQILRQQQPLPLQEEVPQPPTQQQFTYYLQIAAFRSSEKADALRGQMLLSGNQATIKRGQSADGNTLYQVQMGPFEKEDDAERVRAQLALEGYKNISLLEVVR